jgi:hypothetical protein
MSRTFFRYLVGSSIALLFVAVAMVFMFHEPLPTELETWVNAQSETAWTVVDWLGVAAALVSVIASVGLLFFARWARPTYAIALSGTIVVSALGGPYIVTGLEGFFDDFTLLLDGLIIGAAYFSDVSRHFERGTPALQAAPDARAG